MEKGLGFNFADVGINFRAAGDFVRPILRVYPQTGVRLVDQIPDNFVPGQLQKGQLSVLDLADEFFPGASGAAGGDKQTDVAGLQVVDKYVFFIGGLSKAQDRGCSATRFLRKADRINEKK